MKRNRNLPLALALLFELIFLASLTHGQRVSRAESFSPLEQWRSAIAAGNWPQLEELYAPDVQVVTAKGKSQGAAEEIRFWKEQSPSRLALDIADTDSSQGPGTLKTTFEAEFKHKAALGPSATVVQTFYVTCVQLWQKQDDTWRIVGAGHGDPARLKQPLKLNPNLYSANANAREDIGQALARAKKQNKRVILDFGANWCYDCHVLDLAFHHPEIALLLGRNYIVVHVDVGQYDKNLDLAQRYRVPLDKGVPALAVLSADGKLLFSQERGEFEKARSMSPEEIAAFLQKWKAGS